MEREGQFGLVSPLSMDEIPCVLFGVNSDFKVCFWNKEAASSIGKGVNDVIGSEFIALLAEDGREDTISKVKGLLNGNGPGQPVIRNVEMTFLHGGGHVILLVNMNIRKNSSGSMDVICTGQDITSIKASERNMIRTAAELQNFIDLANAAIFGTDEKLLINEWNQQSAQISGLTKEMVIGKEFVKVLIEPDFHDQVSEVLRSALEGRGTSNFEIHVMTRGCDDADKRRIDILLNVTSKRGVDGKIVGVIGVGQARVTTRSSVVC